MRSLEPKTARMMERTNYVCKIARQMDRRKSLSESDPLDSIILNIQTFNCLDSKVDAAPDHGFGCEPLILACFIAIMRR